MNKAFVEIARELIKINLALSTEDYRIMFKKMYSHDNLSRDINEVVDNMPVDKLDWAMQQIQRSIYENIKNHET